MCSCLPDIHPLQLIRTRSPLLWISSWPIYFFAETLRHYGWAYEYTLVLFKKEGKQLVKAQDVDPNDGLTCGCGLVL